MGSKPDVFPLFFSFTFISWGSLSHEVVFLNTLFVSKEFIAFLEIFHYFLGLRLQGIWSTVLKNENSEWYNIFNEC